MAETIPYMGTKRGLSAAVVRATSSCQPGAIVDLFAGMGSVAAAHDGIRAVCANDIQHFAFLNNKCRLTSSPPKLQGIISEAEKRLFQSNMSALENQARDEFRSCERSISAEDYETFSAAWSSTLEVEGTFHSAYCCFVNRYASTYFSLHQCAEVDSIRYLLEALRGFGRINQEDFDWGILCLGAAALRCANTTGHFAQYLRPNVGNWRRVQRQHRRSVWQLWSQSLAQMKPFGETEWRKTNRAYRADALHALEQMKSVPIGVVYCDPPYTNDQYSRFYHLWETLALYDYPESTGKGQYRSDRFVTGFSSVRQVSSAFEALIHRVAEAGADFVLSYPSNGLLHEAGEEPLEIISKYFTTSYLAEEIKFKHSSMGASKGASKNVVAERIYIGRHG